MAPVRITRDGITLRFGDPDTPVPEGIVSASPPPRIVVAVSPVDPRMRVRVTIGFGADQRSMALRLARRTREEQFFEGGFRGLRGGDQVDYSLLVEMESLGKTLRLESADTPGGVREFEVAGRAPRSLGDVPPTTPSLPSAEKIPKYVKTPLNVHRTADSIAAALPASPQSRTSPMLPPTGSFLATLQPADIDGQLDSGEKEMLLAALRFYFGTAQWWNTVRKELSDDNDLDKLHDTLQSPGERYDILERKTSLGDGYFAEEHRIPGQVKLYAATDTRDYPENPDRLPSYFLYEAKNNLTFYVGPGRVRVEGREVLRHVFNALVLHHKGDRKYRPIQSHTLDFGFLDKGEYVVGDLEFFSDLASLASLRPDDIDGPPSKGEKEMLLTALRFYFGPAKKLKAVAKDTPDLVGLNALLQNRYRVLETQTSLGAGYFAREHQAPDRLKLYVATDNRDNSDNPRRLPSYILHEAKNNVMFFVGPDLFHQRPDVKVINIIKLDPRHSGTESHTLDFGFVP
jgi:hypothetical protein